MSKTFTVPCPKCGTDVKWEENSSYRPFCSKQCQMIDFGDWADEENLIPGAPDMSDADGWSEEQH
ncbi:DNA gyrase inhibitor YacG [Vibrio zhanjiangensis]|uniref:DNA gyrase inhibitor YacG n=1 Tax=Vibrio zhanjiangensis TaxID=1046128 RepID=A0ABQ6F3Q0_9VIBR|nr:DNA gyrase inhibitor YacG [Vibrio zhanjiangensis]GLT20148.1 DNA gyrase inhibitor YacG [Vibrio zhanjiangensis]